MKEVVTQTWGWDEAVQDELFKEGFDPAKYSIVVVDGQDVGMFVTKDKGSELFLSEIQISPDYQGKGLGSRILKDLMETAREKSIPLDLQVLKVNRAKFFYEKLGFRVTGENENHLQMRWTHC